MEGNGCVGVRLETSGLHLIPSMLAVASVMDDDTRLELLNEVALILDSFVEKIRSPFYVKALGAVGYPLVDVFELVEALGVEGLEEILSYAVNVIDGVPSTPPRDLYLYADLLGWSKSPEELEPIALGYAIILSFIASFNRTLNELALANFSKAG